MPKHACARLTPQDLCARNFIKGPGRRTPPPFPRSPHTACLPGSIPRALGRLWDLRVQCPGVWLKGKATLSLGSGF